MAEAEQKPYKNLNAYQFAKQLEQEIPQGKYHLANFNGTIVAICRERDRLVMQQQGLIVITPNELAKLYLSDTSKETFQHILEIKQALGGYVWRVEGQHKLPSNSKLKNGVNHNENG